MKRMKEIMEEIMNLTMAWCLIFYVLCIRPVGRWAARLFSVAAILLLWHTESAAQRTVTRDSTWVSNSAGAWFQNRRIDYADGGYVLNVELIGDTATLRNNFLSRVRSEANSMATDARAVGGFRQRIRELIRQGEAMRTQVGENPLTTLVDEIGPALTSQNWQVRMPDTTMAITFTVTDQKNLRYRLGDLATRNAALLGDVLRLNNFRQQGYTLDLYKRGEAWHSLNGDIVLRLRGANVRMVQGPEPEPVETIQPAQPTKAATKKQGKNRRKKKN